MSICQYHPNLISRSLQSTDSEHMEIQIEYCPCAGERTDAEVMEASLGCGTGDMPEFWIHETGMTRGTAEGPGPLYAVLRNYPPRRIAMTDPNARIGAYADATGLELPDGTDTFQHLQKPDLHPAGDPLAAFVKARIIDAELEPRHEFPRVYGLEAGPIAHRYAKHMRADCVVFRRIVELYLDAKATYPHIEDEVEGKAAWDRAIGLRAAVLAVANRWSDHPEFNPDWRL